MRVFVTGVEGFLGSEVARQLLEAGHEVEGCDIQSGRSVVGVAVQPRPCQEVTNLGSADLVVHCAAIPRSTWPNDDELWTQNVGATVSVLKWGLPVIYISSSTAAHPTNYYGITKKFSEHLVLDRPGNLALRPCNIYGPGQSEDDSVTTPNVLAAFRSQREKLGHVCVEGDGSKTRHWVHVSDCARAVVLAAESSVRDRWLDICGERASIGEVASKFGVPVIHKPDRPNDPQDIPQDASPARELLGWEPLISLEAGTKEVTDG